MFTAQIVNTGLTADQYNELQLKQFKQLSLWPTDEDVPDNTEAQEVNVITQSAEAVSGYDR